MGEGRNSPGMLLISAHRQRYRSSRRSSMMGDRHVVHRDGEGRRIAPTDDAGAGERQRDFPGRALALGWRPRISAASGQSPVDAG